MTRRRLAIGLAMVLLLGLGPVARGYVTAIHALILALDRMQPKAIPISPEPPSNLCTKRFTFSAMRVWSL